MPKICKDGRIWGQTNKEAGNHLGILVRGSSRNYIKKGYNPISGMNGFKKGQPPTKGSFLKGAKHPSWKGGITPLRIQIHKLPEYKQWRSNVYRRDNWTCQTCGERGKKLEAHHIKGFAKILKENNITSVIEAQLCKELWDVNNGVALCQDCHNLTKNYRVVRR